MPFSTTTFGHAESNWAALVCFSITGFTASMPVMDLFWSRTKPRPPRLQAGRGVVSHLQQTLRKQPSRPLKSILNSHFCRKPERKMFPEVCMFSSQCYCSYLLNLFSFSRPVFSLRHLLCLLSSCSLSAVSRLMSRYHWWKHNVDEMLLHIKGC